MVVRTSLLYFKKGINKIWQGPKKLVKIGKMKMKCNKMTKKKKNVDGILLKHSFFHSVGK